MTENVLNFEHFSSVDFNNLMFHGIHKCFFALNGIEVNLSFPNEKGLRRNSLFDREAGRRPASRSLVTAPENSFCAAAGSVSPSQAAGASSHRIALILFPGGSPGGGCLPLPVGNGIGTHLDIENMI